MYKPSCPYIIFKALRHLGYQTILQQVAAVLLGVFLQTHNNCSAIIGILLSLVDDAIGLFGAQLGHAQSHEYFHGVCVAERCTPQYDATYLRSFYVRRQFNAPQIHGVLKNEIVFF